MSDESPPPLNAMVLRRLEIGALICSFAPSLAAQANAGLREAQRPLTRRDHVLIGLALKIERSFRALLDDCRVQRSEAMHHFKTMAECMIYFYAVLNDASETTARRVLAKVLQDEARFLRENKGDPAEIAEIEAHRAELLAGGLTPLPTVRDLANAAKVSDWYSRIYRMACEPAHIGDVFELMPLGDEPIVIGPAPILASARADEALWYGGLIALSIMRSIIESASLGLTEPVDELEREFRGDGPAAPVPVSPPHPGAASG